MLFAPGRRLLSIASIAMVLTAILHTIGNFAPPPVDDAFTALDAAMRGYRFPMGLGMEPSARDITQTLSLTMSVCLLALGVLGLVLAAARDATPRLLSRTAAVIAAASGLLTVLYAVYRIPPPMISLAVVALLYVAAAVTTRQHPTTSGPR